MKDYFYQEAVRKYTAVMIDLFDDMVVRDEDADGETVYEKKIPCHYAPKEKRFYWLQQIAQDRNLDTSLPRMSVSLDSLALKMDRSLNAYRRRRFRLPDGNYTDLMPIPYDFAFTLTAFSKYTDHAAQITENIVPFFSPALFVELKEREKETEAMEREIKIVLDSVGFGKDPAGGDTHVGERADRLVFFSEYKFTLEGFIYRPLTGNRKIIYWEDIRMHIVAQQSEVPPTSAAWPADHN